MSGWNISPHHADGYAFGATGFVHVSQVASDALVIESGKRVRLAPNEPQDWLVSGRGNGLTIALVHTATHSFRGVDLRPFLTANPSHLEGQVVEHGGSSWRVASATGATVELIRGGETQTVPVDELLDANLDAMRARAVLIVDKG